MLLINKTKEKYGYDPNSLKPKSDKLVICQCEYCGKEVEKKNSLRTRQYKILNKDCCSNKECIKQKREESCMTKFGALSPFGSANTQEMVKKTFQQKYNGNSPFVDKTIREKSKQSLLEKYGVDNYSKTNEYRSLWKDKRHPNQDHLPEEFFDELYLKNKHQMEKMSLTEIEACLGINGKAKTLAKQFRKLGIPIQSLNISSQEHEMVEYIRSLIPGIEIVTNTRNIIPPYELDIYLPEYNIAIEMCGIYYHCEKFHPEKEIHSRKQQRCEKAGIQLLTIWSDEWYLQKDIVQNIVAHKLSCSLKKIYARKCNVRKCDFTEAREFLEKYHIQGFKTASWHFCLEYNSEIVAVMSFGKSRFDNKEDVELYRYASDGLVIGGLGKLFSYAQKYIGFETCFTYVDLRYGTGNGYKKIGFKKLGLSSLGFDFVNCKASAIRVSRYCLQKKQLLPMGAVGDSGRELAESIGYYRLWNCGNLRMIWNNT